MGKIKKEMTKGSISACWMGFCPSLESFNETKYIFKKKGDNTELQSVKK